MTIPNFEGMSAHLALLNLMECVGVDNRRHFCISFHETTLCGKGIKSKKDRCTRYGGGWKYDCPECDGRVDILVEEEDRELRKLP